MKIIEIFYRTGDSFESNDAHDEIPLLFSTKKAVINAIYDIEEHSQYYDKIDNSNTSLIEKERLYKELKKKKWFYPSKDKFIDYSEEKINKIKKDEEFFKIYKKIMNDDLTWADDYEWESNIYLFDDNGKKYKLNVFWKGVFEEFYKAEIKNNKK